LNTWADDATEIPPGVLTVRVTVPAALTGELTLHELVDAHETEVTAFVPNSTVVAPATKPVPVRTTAVPPVRRPAFAVTRVIVGTGS
jgi:hypothetical protein